MKSVGETWRMLIQFNTFFLLSPRAVSSETQAGGATISWHHAQNHLGPRNHLVLSDQLVLQLPGYTLQLGQILQGVAGAGKALESFVKIVRTKNLTFQCQQQDRGLLHHYCHHYLFWRHQEAEEKVELRKDLVRWRTSCEHGLISVQWVVWNGQKNMNLLFNGEI